MKHSSSNTRDIQEKIKQELDQHPLQRSTIDALNQARRQALEPQPLWLSQYAKPVLAFASVCAISLLIFLITKPSAPEFTSDSIEAFELLSNNDALEMYENLEFYLWLDEELKS